jgi:NADH-quinone oxidoreductase subunit F
MTAQQAEETAVSGCGSIEVYDTKTTSVEFLSKIFNFYAKESCGKCTPCRDGSWQLKQIIEKLDKNQEIPWTSIASILLAMEQSSFCGLGKSIVISIRSYAKNILGLEI